MTDVIKENKEYLKKLECSIEQAKNGKVIIKTIEELKAMENEQNFYEPKKQ